MAQPPLPGLFSCCVVFLAFFYQAAAGLAEVPRGALANTLPAARSRNVGHPDALFLDGERQNAIFALATKTLFPALPALLIVAVL